MADVPLPEAGGVVHVGGRTIEVAELSGTIGDQPVARSATPRDAGILAALERQHCRVDTPPIHIDAQAVARRAGGAAEPSLRLLPPSTATTRSEEKQQVVRGRD